MGKVNKGNTKKHRGPGRPAREGGRDPVTPIRFPKALLDAVARWAAQQTDKPARSEAIRRLVSAGLNVKSIGKS